MIYITGDTHIPIDIRKLSTTNFSEQKLLNKNDYLIICGDFGGVWDNSNEELHWRKWLNDKPFTTLFVDGNHENFDILYGLKVKEWNGGKVHFVENSVIHLMRGQIFNIDGFKIFTMGGATSIDKYHRIEGKSWWKQEIPCQEEYEEALNNLDKHDWSVDLVITHTASMKIMQELCYIKENNSLNGFFNMLEEELDFKHWYFGHFHDDVNFQDKKHTLIYERIIKIS